LFEGFIRSPEIVLLQYPLKSFLTNKTALEEDPFGDDVHARLDNLLKVRDRQGKPVFILLRYQSLLKKFITDLHAALPRITLFVLTGDELPDTSAFEPTPMRLLEPLLQPGAEKQAQNDYDYAVSVIQP
jgi:hypothetical protein